MNEKQNAQHYFCQSSCLYLTLWPIHFTDFFRYSVHVWIQRIYGHYNISLNFGSTVIFYSLLFIYLFFDEDLSIYFFNLFKLFFFYLSYYRYYRNNISAKTLWTSSSVCYFNWYRMILCVLIIVIWFPRCFLFILTESENIISLPNLGIEPWLLKY